MINGGNTTVTGTRHFFGLRRPVHVSEDCKLCHIIIIPRHSNLMNHETNEKHRVPPTGQTAFKVKTAGSKSEALKLVEFQIVVSIASHSVIRSVDHLGEIMVTH